MEKGKDKTERKTLLVTNFAEQIIDSIFEKACKDVWRGEVKKMEKEKRKRKAEERKKNWKNFWEKMDWSDEH